MITSATKADGSVATVKNDRDSHLQSGLMWCWNRWFRGNCLYVSVSLVMLLTSWMISRTAHADGTVTIELNDPTKTVFGSNDCSSRIIILQLLWSLSPESSTTLKPSTEVLMKIYLGDSASGLKIAEQKHTVSTTQTTQLSKIKYDGYINTAGSDARKSNGLEENDENLHAIDLIGYYRTKVQPENPVPTNFCTLESVPGNDEPRSVRMTFEASYTVIKIDNTNPANPITTETSQKASGTIDIRYDLQPPKSPTDLTLSALEKSITLKWSGDSTNKHTVYFSKSVFTANNLPSARSQDMNVTGTSYTLTGLEQQTPYYVAIQALDDAGNASGLSEVKTITTKELTDFYEYYRNSGGKDKGYGGGVYCFIATAAYGHYDHSYVRMLRQFRDQFLLSNTPGRAFVSWYYKYSPPWAQWLHQSPAARKSAQILLLPVIGVAYLFLHPWWFLLPLLLLLSWLWWRNRRDNKLRLRLIGVMFAVGLLGVLTAGKVHAQETSESSNFASPRNFGLELRVGPYRPMIDTETGVKQAKPFEKFFSNVYQPYLEVGFEWLLYKGFGTVGLNGSVGISWGSAAVFDPDGNRVSNTTSSTPSSTSSTTSSTTATTAASSTNSTFWVVPLRLDVVYRFDYLLQRYRVPVVPYVRAGVDYFIWFITQPSGDLAVSGGDTAVGGRFGFHVGVGLQLELNFIDPVAARTFDVEVGVNHTFLFIEWNSSWVGIVSDGLNLSDHMIRAGLMFQF